MAPLAPVFSGERGRGRGVGGEGVVAAADHVVSFSLGERESRYTAKPASRRAPVRNIHRESGQKSKRCLTSYFALTSPKARPLTPDPSPPRKGGEGSQYERLSRWFLREVRCSNCAGATKRVGANFEPGSPRPRGGEGSGVRGIAYCNYGLTARSGVLQLSAKS